MRSTMNLSFIAAKMQQVISTLLLLLLRMNKAKYGFSLEFPKTRLNRIRSGAIDLHDAFADPEDGFLFQVTDPFDDNAPPQTVSVAPNQISGDMLPIPGERLDLKSDTLPQLNNPEDLAKSKRQELVNLILNFPDFPSGEAPAASISLIFKGLQDVLYTIGTIHANATRANEQIKKNMRISLLEVGAGSFDVRLASTELVDMLGDSKFGECDRRTPKTPRGRR